MRTIILTGGGTAGHVLGNVALLPKLQTFFDKIIYIGSEKGIEKDILSQYPDIEYIPIQTTKFIRKWTFKNLSIPIVLLKSIRQCKKIIDLKQPNIIFSKGGYVSLPVVIAGHKKGIPVISHESDLSIGLANRLTENKVKCICTTFPETAQKLKKGLWVGALIRQNLFRGNKEKTKSQFKIPKNLPVLLVLGGSLGANSVNNLVWENLDFLCSSFFVIHITGRNKAKAIQHKNYAQLEYCQIMEDVLSVADFALTRGGSNTLWELVALKIPMLIVPLSKKVSRGDQVENANYFEQKGYALTLSEENLTAPYFQQKIKELQNKKDLIVKNMQETSQRDSLESVFRTIKKYTKP